MGVQKSNNNKDQRLVLSSDAKPRLKWTPELHQRFVDAISQLGGAEKATPKSLMRLMNIHGLTLYHLKSHLQKFRLAKSQPYQDNKQEDNRESVSHLSGDSCDEAQSEMNENKQIARALQMQMEVQRKLHEQIEVQRHLQLRIEAQGKYLQCVMKKAQETLAGYGCSASGMEFAKAELSKLVSMVDIGCLSSSLESSSLTSSDTTSAKQQIEAEETQTLTNDDDDDDDDDEMLQARAGNSVELSLMEMHPSTGRKRRRNQTSTISDNDCVDDQIFKADEDRKFKKFGFLDLNAKSLIDLNCNGVEQFNAWKL